MDSPSQPQLLNAPMSCRHLVLIALLSLVLGAQAREQSQTPSQSQSRSDVRSESPARSEAGPRSDTVHALQDSSAKARSQSDADALLQEQLLRQKRRDVLREALRAQAGESPAALRQMSLQERMELRQQLRQQQEWLK